MMSKLRNRGIALVDEERGVSPVIGVALLIAITVVLAAVIGFVVLDAGTGPVDTPSARLSLTAEQGDTTVTVVHDGGDTLQAGNLEVVTTADGRQELTDVSGATGVVRTGDTVTITLTTALSSGDTIRIVWDSPDSEERSQIASLTIP